MFSTLDVYLRKLAAIGLNTVESGREIAFARVKLIENDVNDLHAVKK